MKTLKQIGKVLEWLCIVSLVYVAVRGSFWLLSAPFDWAVVVGTLLLTLTIYTVVRIGMYWWKKMDNWFKAKANQRTMIGLIVVCCVLSWTGCTMVGPGHAGIVVNKAGSNKGVQEKAAQTGWLWYWPPTEDVVEYTVAIETAKWTADTNEGHPVDESITFTNKTSMAISVDVSVSYSLDFSKVSYFYTKFLAEDDKEKEAKFTHGFLRNIARDCFNEHGGKYEIEQIMGDNAQFVAETRKCIQDQVTPYGVVIEQFGLIGAPRPPQQIIQSINMKVQAQQLALQKQMELTQVQADAAKQVAAAEGQAKAQVAQAQGEAEANRLRNSAITDKIIEMRRLDNQHDWIYRWNGQAPQVVMGEKGATPLIQLPQ